MKKIIALFTVVFVVHTSGTAQITLTAAEKLRQANEEVKTALVSKLTLSEEAASKIVVVENEFFNRLAVITSLGNIPVKEREIKLNEAHTVRRTNLRSTPLTPRQMEDVIELSGQIRRKHKL